MNEYKSIPKKSMYLLIHRLFDILEVEEINGSLPYSF